ncbi:uncharacterized protein G2W53_038345 [Senna tora]|uniref:Uncharacterized protein n=1 Tax=Senna tora TaxID=362788 RepID=A0A834SLL5_9FABA|nr:uncharacterized protein G2W53_038345 [Senna tora]
MDMDAAACAYLLAFSLQVGGYDIKQH